MTLTWAGGNSIGHCMSAIHPFSQSSGLNVSSLTQYNIASCRFTIGVLVACMQLYIRTSVHACLSFYTLYSSSSIALICPRCINCLQEIWVSNAVRQRCVALALHLGHSSSATQSTGVKHASNKVLNFLEACACWTGT